MRGSAQLRITESCAKRRSVTASIQIHSTKKLLEAHLAFGSMTKSDFIQWGSRTLDQWYAEMRFRKICGEVAAKLLRESKKARKLVKGKRCGK